MKASSVARLDRTQFESGVSACVENAAQLIEEAKTLEAGGRYPRAAALAIVALEELSKLPIIMGLHTCKAGAERQQLWRAFSDHKHKLRIDAALVAFREGTSEEYLKVLFRPEGIQLIALREAALYVNFVNDAFVRPDDGVDATRCAALVEDAEHSLAFHRAIFADGLPSAVEIETRNLIASRRHTETDEEYRARLGRVGELNQKATKGDASAMVELRAMLALARKDERR